MMGELEDLRGALRVPLPGEDLDRLSRLLSRAAEEGVVEVDDEEEALILEGEKLLIPRKYAGGQGWGSRTLSTGEFLMPEVVRETVKLAEETGRWDPVGGLERYLRSIDEPDREEFLEVFTEIRENISHLSGRGDDAVRGDDLVAIAESYGLRSEDADRIRQEFKKGGVISPCGSGIREGCLRFRMNPSLLR